MGKILFRQSKVTLSSAGWFDAWKHGGDDVMRAFAAAILILVGLTASVSARTQFTVYGANGDRGNTDECPVGQFMMGIEARTGAWFDQIAVVCGEMKRDGTGTLIRKETLDRRGGNGGGGPAATVCNDNEAVSKLRAWRTDGYQIRSVELTCQNMATGATHVILARGTETSPDAHSPPHTCTLPERATGLVIRHGKHVNGLALVCDKRSPRPITTGSHDLHVVLPKNTLQFFTYKPTCANPQLLIVFHGVNRNAADYRDWAKPIADKNCLIVVTPLFDAKTFPDWAYAKGGIINNGAFQPIANWTGQYVKAIVSWVRWIESRPVTFSLIGHSAGAQFLSRTAAFLPTEARRIVIANAGSHAFPDLTAQAPYGFGGVFPRSIQDGELKRYLAAPVTIYIGEGDTGSDLLDTSAPAMAQGKTRFERGENVFKAAEALATKNRWPFNWRKVPLKGTGHSAQAMFSAKEALDALKP